MVVWQTHNDHLGGVCLWINRVKNFQKHVCSFFFIPTVWHGALRIPRERQVQITRVPWNYFFYRAHRLARPFSERAHRSICAQFHPVLSYFFCFGCQNEDCSATLYHVAISGRKTQASVFKVWIRSWMSLLQRVQDQPD